MRTSLYALVVLTLVSAAAGQTPVAELSQLELASDPSVAAKVSRAFEQTVPATAPTAFAFPIKATDPPTYPQNLKVEIRVGNVVSDYEQTISVTQGEETATVMIRPLTTANYTARVTYEIADANSWTLRYRFDSSFVQRFEFTNPTVEQLPATAKLVLRSQESNAVVFSDTIGSIGGVLDPQRSRVFERSIRTAAGTDTLWVNLHGWKTGPLPRYFNIEHALHHGAMRTLQPGNIEIVSPPNPMPISFDPTAGGGLTDEVKPYADPAHDPYRSGRICETPDIRLLPIGVDRDVSLRDVTTFQDVPDLPMIVENSRLRTIATGAHLLRLTNTGGSSRAMRLFHRDGDSDLQRIVRADLHQQPPHYRGAINLPTGDTTISIDLIKCEAGQVYDLEFTGDDNGKRAHAEKLRKLLQRLDRICFDGATPRDEALYVFFADEKVIQKIGASPNVEQQLRAHAVALRQTLRDSLNAIDDAIAVADGLDQLRGKIIRIDRSLTIIQDADDPDEFWRDYRRLQAERRKAAEEIKRYRQRLVSSRI